MLEILSGSTDDIQTTFKWVLHSKTVYALLVALIMVVARLAGADVSNENALAIAGDIITILTLLFAIYGRFVARKPLAFKPPSP